MTHHLQFKSLGLTILLFGILAVVTFGAYSVETERDILITHQFPEIIGDWHSVKDWYAQNPETAKAVFENLETEDTIYREYKDVSGNSIDLVIVYSPHNRKVVHPPDICFQGGGWQQQIKDARATPFSLALGLDRVNRLVLDRGGQKQIALYWYKSGNHQMSSFMKQQVGYLINSVLRRERGSALIRLSTYADSADKVAEKTQQLEAFAKQVVPLVDTVIHQ
jgi:EpsI family protein